MIKHINHQNLSTTPFVAVKSWDLYNIQNESVLILEPSIYPDNTTIAYEYIQYSGNSPSINSDCNIALEQQDEDRVDFEEGITGSGVFDLDTDLKNSNGSYKRLVHNQIKTTFYNTYHDPTKIFGVEYIDFPLSRTLRNLADQFRMFTIPRLIFGEKIVPGSVKFYDNVLDDNVEIFDDGYQNLLGGSHLFSKVQEVRFYTSPSSSNLILPGTASCSCVNVSTLTITQPQDISRSIGESGFFDVTASGVLPIYYQWQSGSYLMTDNSRVTGSNTSRVVINNLVLTDSGSYRVLVWNETLGVTSSYAQLTINVPPPVSPYITASVNDTASISLTLLAGSLILSPLLDSIPATTFGLLTGSLVDVIVSVTGSQDSSSVDSMFLSGSLVDIVVLLTGSQDLSSVDSMFLTGSLVDVVVMNTGSQDSASVDSMFLSGSVSTVMITASKSDSFAFSVGLISGNLS